MTDRFVLTTDSFPVGPSHRTAREGLDRLDFFPRPKPYLSMPRSPTPERPPPKKQRVNFSGAAMDNDDARWYLEDKNDARWYLLLIILGTLHRVPTISLLILPSALPTLWTTFLILMNHTPRNPVFLLGTIPKRQLRRHSAVSKSNVFILLLVGFV